MAFQLFADSFGRYPTGQTNLNAALLNELAAYWTSVGGNIIIENTGRTSQCVTIGFGSNLNKTVKHTSQMTVGFAFRWNAGFPSDATVFTLRNNGTAMAVFDRHADGTLSLWAGNHATLIGTMDIETHQTKWYWIDLHFEFSGSSNISMSASFRVNGNDDSEVSGSGATNVNAANLASQAATANVLELDAGVSNGSSSFCDFAYHNEQGGVLSGYFGDIRILPIFPNGDGSSLQWTPNTGSTHYTLVNEHTPDDDTTYVESQTVDDVDLWDWEDVPSFSGTIRGVCISMYARKNDEGSKSFAIVTDSGFQSSDFWVGDKYEYYIAGLDADPSTGAAWTRAGFNGAQFGLKLTN